MKRFGVRRQASHPHFSSEIDTEGSWAISYGDMVTLLLTFFIMFFAADKFNRSKSEPTVDLKMTSLALKEALTGFEDKSDSPSEQVLAKVKGKVYKLGQRVIVEFPEVSFFKSGELNVTSRGLETLKEFYERYHPFMGHYQLGIRAFTDTKKVRIRTGLKFQDNLELSALRSVAVMRHLRDYGIPLTLMKLSGYGEMLLTLRDLERIPESIRKPSSIDDLARTVVLVIEPKEEP